MRCVLCGCVCARLQKLIDVDETQYPNFTLEYLGPYQRRIYIRHMVLHLHELRIKDLGCNVNENEVEGAIIKCE